MIPRWVDKNLKYIFTLPAVIFVLIMIVFPIAYIFKLSFFKWSMSNVTPPEWVALGNYISLLKDERFLMSVARTFIFTFFALSFEMFLGVIFALMLNTRFKGKNFGKTMFLLPMVSTPVAVGMVWMLIYEPTIGLANHVLSYLGVPAQAWLGNPKLALFSLAFIDIWQWTPMIVLMVLAGLTSLSKEPYESAMVDGANKWQTFWNITLPLLKSTLLVALLLRFIDVFKTFDIIYATTQGGPDFSSETMNILGLILGFQYFEFGKASAMLVYFFILVLGISFIFMKLRKKAEVEY